mgnify:CR=1 FL=1
MNVKQFREIQEVINELIEMREKITNALIKAQRILSDELHKITKKGNEENENNIKNKMGRII